jgi:acyl-CoA synthetase (AMP-forming)/AMP-acid ligase II
MTSLRPEDQLRKAHSVGHPLPGVEIQVVDEHDRPLPPGQVGEILVRCGKPGQYTIMKGYLGDEEANRQSFLGDWFRTGDVGYFHDEGYLYITDRKKDMIVSGGLNIYSKEVENVLLEHPGVLEAAVVGVPDPEWGEAVVACVVPAPGHSPTADELIAFCRERLASYKKPRHIRFLAQLPKNAAGKVLKGELRQWVRKELGCDG